MERADVSKLRFRIFKILKKIENSAKVFGLTVDNYNRGKNDLQFKIWRDYATFKQSKS